MGFAKMEGCSRLAALWRAMCEMRVQGERLRRGLGGMGSEGLRRGLGGMGSEGLRRYEGGGRGGQTRRCGGRRGSRKCYTECGVPRGWWIHLTVGGVSLCCPVIIGKPIPSKKFIKFEPSAWCVVFLN
jgi:hypothetical protein